MAAAALLKVAIASEATPRGRPRNKPSPAGSKRAKAKAKRA